MVLNVQIYSSLKTCGNQPLEGVVDEEDDQDEDEIDLDENEDDENFVIDLDQLTTFMTFSLCSI